MRDRDAVCYHINKTRLKIKSLFVFQVLVSDWNHLNTPPFTLHFLLSTKPTVATKHVKNMKGPLQSQCLVCLFQANVEVDFVEDDLLLL